MAREEASLKTFMLVQTYNPDYWEWTDEEKKALGDPRRTAEIVKKRLEDGGCIIDELHAITHDKDEHKLWDDYNMQYMLKFSEPHIHILVKFGGDCAKTLTKIAELIGIKPNYIEKPHKGRYAYDNMLSYLIHIKYMDKYQYRAQDVITLCGKPYMEYSSERHEAWIKGKAKRLQKDLDDIYEEIAMRIIEEPDFNMPEIMADENYKKACIVYLTSIKALLEKRESVNDIRDACEKGEYEAYGVKRERKKLMAERAKLKELMERGENGTI